MAYGGLISAALGATQGAGDIATKNIDAQRDVESKTTLYQRELEMKAAFEDSVARNQQMRADNAETKIHTAATGLIETRDQDALKAYNAKLLSDNPDNPQLSIDEWKNASDRQTPTERDMLQARVDSSTGTQRKQGLIELKAHDSALAVAAETARKEARDENKSNNEAETNRIRDKMAENSARKLDAIIANSGGEGKDTARIKNAKYLLDNNIVTSPAEAWEKSSELGGKSAEEVLRVTAQNFLSDAKKNFVDMTPEEAVQKAKDLMSAVKGVGKKEIPKPSSENRKPLSAFGS